MVSSRTAPYQNDTALCNGSRNVRGDLMVFFIVPYKGSALSEFGVAASRGR